MHLCISLAHVAVCLSSTSRMPVLIYHVLQYINALYINALCIKALCSSTICLRISKLCACAYAPHTTLQ